MLGFGKNKVQAVEASSPFSERLRRATPAPQIFSKDLMNNSENMHEVKYLDLGAVLKTTTNYDGFRHMFVALLVALIFIQIELLGFEDRMENLMHFQVQEALQSTPSSDMSIWESIHSMEDAARYLTDWFQEHAELSNAANENGTVYINDQFRVLAYHLEVVYPSSEAMSEGAAKNMTDEKERAIRSIPETALWWWERHLWSTHKLGAEYIWPVYSHRHGDFTDTNTCDTEICNLKHSKDAMAALSADPNHWVTSRDRDEERHANFEPPDSRLSLSPFYIPRRSYVRTSRIQVTIIYDMASPFDPYTSTTQPDKTVKRPSPLPSYRSSSRRFIGKSRVIITYPLLGISDFFQASSENVVFVNFGISDSGHFDQTYELLLRLPLEIFCLFWFIYCLFYEMSILNAAMVQQSRTPTTAAHQKKYCWHRCKEGCRLCCCRCGWSTHDIYVAGSAIVLLIVIVIAHGIFPILSETNASIVKRCVAFSNCYMGGGNFQPAIGGFQNLVTVMLIISVFKYTRYHDGMRVYTMLFHESWKTMRDFIPWFALLMFTQAWIVTILFIKSGTSSDWTTLGAGFSVVMKLIFGFYDYDQFVGNSIGLGALALLAPLTFWMCLFLGVVVAQNVMLAIVGQAYDNVQKTGQTLTTTMPLWTQAYRRTRFCLRRLRVKALRRTTLPEYSNCNENDTAIQEGLSQSRKQFFEAINHLPACERRWFAVRFPGVKILLDYFTNFFEDEELTYPLSHWHPEDLCQRVGAPSAQELTESPSSNGREKKSEDDVAIPCVFAVEGCVEHCLHTLDPNRKKSNNSKYQNIPEGCITKLELLTMLRALWASQKQKKHAMFLVQRCCCGIGLKKHFRCGIGSGLVESDYRLDSKGNPCWNPDDVAEILFWAFGQTVVVNDTQNVEELKDQFKQFKANFEKKFEHLHEAILGMQQSIANLHGGSAGDDQWR
jgi:hypothetical protein